MNEQPRGNGKHTEQQNVHHAQNAQYAEQTHHTTDTSSMGLVTQLTREVTTLVTKEVALARSELTHAMKATKAGVGSVASGGMVLHAGVLTLLAAAVFGLAEFMAPWLAALIVGGVVTLIGFAMVKAGKRKLEPSAFRPTHTERSLRKDKDAIKGATS